MMLRRQCPWISLLFLPLLAALLPFTTADGSTKIYINTVTGYSQLTSCAEGPLSTVVRGMSSGCGDGNSLTSYTCFCTDSSSKMSSVISHDVSSQCISGRNNASFAMAQVSSAVGVFDAYCALGLGATSTTASSAASPTPAATSAAPTQTATTSPSPSSTSSRTTAIAAGVTVPLVTVALALGAFFLHRARKRTTENVRGAGAELSGEERRGDFFKPVHEAGGVEVQELGEVERMELDGRAVVGELEAGPRPAGKP